MRVCTSHAGGFHSWAEALGGACLDDRLRLSHDPINLLPKTQVPDLLTGLSASWGHTPRIGPRCGISRRTLPLGIWMIVIVGNAIVARVIVLTWSFGYPWP